MKPWKMLLVANGVLLAVLMLVAGPLRSPLSAQGGVEPSLSPCCKTAIEGTSSAAQIAVVPGGDA